jgi:tRNA-dihydrouridine synthase
MSDVPAHWDIIREVVKMRNRLKSKTLIIGNGDVVSLADAQEKYKKYGVDGVMVGRALFGTPQFFSFDKKLKNKLEKPKEKLKLALEHTKLFEKIFKGKKHFDIMKKHYKAYISGFDDAKKMRMKLMKVKNFKEAEIALKKVITGL